MTTGDVPDVHARIKRLIPRWFGQDQAPTPVLDALLQAPAHSLSWVHSLIVYARRQTRIVTATGAWLDLIAADFFGRGLPRRAAEADSAYSARIRAGLFRERGTRAALISAITEANGGRAPARIFEVAVGGAEAGALCGAGLGYNVAGGWASDLAGADVYIDIAPKASEPPHLPSGWGQSHGAFGRGRLEWADADSIETHPVFAEILAAIERVRPAGVRVFVRWI